MMYLREGRYALLQVNYFVTVSIRVNLQKRVLPAYKAHRVVYVPTFFGASMSTDNFNFCPFAIELVRSKLLSRVCNLAPDT